MGSEVVQPSTVVEGWRLALLLLVFATVTFFLEKTLHILEEVFKSRRGLAIALAHIKNELFFVGSISLLLSAFQNLLAQICIPKYSTSLYTDRRRRLLAGVSSTYCEPSKQSLWPVSLQHDTHIFIFVVACTHVVYGTITVYLTIWRVRSWRNWEEKAQAEARTKRDLEVLEVPPFVNMPAKFLYRNVGRNPVLHFFLMLFRQYQLSVNQTLYNNVRVLFIEKHGLQYTFNFHEVVIKGLEEQLMRTLHPEWHLWIIAVIWYAIPPPAYVSFWMYGIAFLTIMLVGGKLVDILVQISVQVARKYHKSVVFGRMDDNPRAHGRITALGRSSVRPPGARETSVQQQFMERAGKAGKLFQSPGKGLAGAAEEAPAAPPSWLQNQMASLGTLFQVPSRDDVLSIVRSWALEMPRFGTSAEKKKEESGKQGEGETPLQADRDMPMAPPTGGVVMAAASAPEAAGKASKRGDDEGGAAAAACSPQHCMGLVRLSAPAELRRQGGRRYNFVEVGPSGSPTCAGSPTHVAPPAARRNMSIITEGSRHHQQHHSQALTWPDSPKFNVQQQKQQLSSRAQIYALNCEQQQQEASGGRKEDSQQQPELPRVPTDSRRSVFETFQHHPSHRSRALSLRRALLNILGPNEEGHASPRTPQSLLKQSSHPQSQQQSQPQQELLTMRQASKRLQSAGAAAQEVINKEKGTVADADAIAVVEEGLSSQRASKSLSPAPYGVQHCGAGGEITVAHSGEGLTGNEPSSGRNPSLVRHMSRKASQVISAVGHDGSSDCGSGDEGLWRRSRRALKLRKTVSGRRKVPLLMRPFYCGTYVKGTREYVREMLENRPQLDAMDLFWFRRPRVMTLIFTLAYFQNSLSIAICIFSLAGMQDAVGTWEGVPHWAIILQLCMDALLVPQVSLSILPFYALIQPVGSHCPQELIAFANMKDDEAKKAKKSYKRGWWISQWSTHLSSDNTAQRDTRNILGRLGFVRNGKAKVREQPPVEEPPAATARQLSSKVAVVPRDMAKSFSSSPSGRTFSRNESAASTRATQEVLSSRLKPNGTSAGAMGPPALRTSLSLRHVGPQPATLQQEISRPVPIANDVPKFVALGPNGTVAVTGNSEPFRSMVTEVVDKQANPTLWTGQKTFAEDGLPQPQQSVVPPAAGTVEAGMVTLGAQATGPPSQHISDDNIGIDHMQGAQSPREDMPRVNTAITPDCFGDTRRPDLSPANEA